MTGSPTTEVLTADRLNAAPPSLSAAEPMTIAVVIPTLGRAVTVRKTIERLKRQSRPPDRVLAVGVSPADIAGLEDAAVHVETYLAPIGSCSQRNHALDRVAGDCDLIFFLDDDFLLADNYLELAERLFREYPDIVGANGRVLADGVNGPGLAFEEAEAILAADTTTPPYAGPTRTKDALYGCNMMVRASAIGDVRFDETLPLYGWQEDIDFTFRVAARGRLVGCRAMSGVHMGEKRGRTSGKRFGYSQIANPIYLLRKASMPRDLAWKNMRNNLAANVWKSLRPEAYIDRRGRLLGNLIAFRDLMLGKIDPRRILEMK